MSGSKEETPKGLTFNIVANWVDEKGERQQQQFEDTPEGIRAALDKVDQEDAKREGLTQKKRRTATPKEQRGKVSANWDDEHGVRHQEFFEDTEAGIAAAFERLEAPDVAKWIGVKRRGRECLEMPLDSDQIDTIAWGFAAGQSKAYLSEAARLLYIQSHSFDKLWSSMLKDRRERKKMEEAIEQAMGSKVDDSSE